MRVKKYGLKIKDSDWNVPSEKHDAVNFLDINFWFDSDLHLQTDLYQKPTDARNYLNFTSCHPNSTFSSVVHSQSIRLRRIINDDQRLQLRLGELREDLTRCYYPKSLIDSIFCKVTKMQRILTKKPVNAVSDDNRIMAITTHGRDDKLVKTLKRIEKKSSNITFRYVKKTAPSFKNTLVKSKHASLGHPKGKTEPCKKRKCMTCSMVSKQDHIIGPQNKVIKTAKAFCNTRCVCYHAACRLCDKNYVGKTIQPLNSRINGHRKKFYDCLGYNGDRRDLECDDDHALGLHLYFQHGQRSTQGFNRSFAFTVLERCNPQNLDLKEHLWIQRLQTIKPYGLNSHDPFGFPFVL